MMHKQPDFSGHWRANLERSTFRVTAPRSLDMVIEHQGDSLRQKVLSVSRDGSEQKALFTCRTNGALGTGRLNGEMVAGRAWWMDVELMIELVIPTSQDELRLIDCWTLSNDHRKLTMRHRDDALAGQFVELDRVA
jgi:hypothetical protein